MNIKTFILVLLLLSVAQLGAQNTLQVVTRAVQKTFPCKSGYNVEITAEKAEIEVKLGQSTDKNIHINAELVARHARLDSAKTDLDSWKFLTNSIGKTIYVRAYIGLEKKQKLPSSNLKAKITITVPPDCGAVVTNKFGKIRIENISGDVRLNGEFCGIFLKNIAGNVTLLGNYGSLEANEIKGVIDIKSKRAEIALKDISGNCSVSSEYGNIFIDSGPAMGNLNVQATKCDVTLDAKNATKHSFQLIANYGQILTPSGALFNTNGSGKNTQRADLKVNKAMHNIKVLTDFGKITIR
jgi:Putative adhesin